jgi:hypothetical protein
LHIQFDSLFFCIIGDACIFIYTHVAQRHGETVLLRLSKLKIKLCINYIGWVVDESAEVSLMYLEETGEVVVHRQSLRNMS